MGWGGLILKDTPPHPQGLRDTTDDNDAVSIYQIDLQGFPQPEVIVERYLHKVPCNGTELGAIWLVCRLLMKQKHLCLVEILKKQYLIDLIFIKNVNRNSVVSGEGHFLLVSYNLTNSPRKFPLISFYIFHYV